MKFRGGLLALLVLGIATILMVFFVMPRINSDKATTDVAAPAANPAAVADKKPAETASAPAVDPAAATAAAGAKMARLMQDADGAVTKLSNLFAEGKVPAQEAFNDARFAAETALKALTAENVPEGLDASLADALAKARSGAGKAIDLLAALPAEAQAAASQIAGLLPAMTGNAVAPQSESQPSTAAAPAQPQTATPATSAPSAPAGQADASTPAGVIPKFDILRVEPDGSTVIAGTAAPNAKVEIFDGSKVLATIDAGPSGDFAGVLDTPLSVGDHSIVLRSVGANGPTTSDEVATVSVPKTGDGQLLAMISKPGEASRVITAPENVTSADKQQRVAANDPAATAPAISTPELPSASATLATSAPVIAPETNQAAAPAATGTAEIKVTAVEIEGNRIFIAGTAPTGSRIRAYADETVVGEASVDGSGHFVVEGTVDLAVGDHTIRVDLLDASGQVTVRASVPFNRPAGEQLAVVAPSTAGSATSVAIDNGAFDQQRAALSQAFGLLQGLYADGKTPTLEALAAARSATEIALKSLAEFGPIGDASAQVNGRVAATVSEAGKALAALQALPRTVEAVGKALPQIAALIDQVLNAGGTSAPAESASAPAAGTSEPKTIEQAPLTASKNSVIIRQGDTLWQISRRVYGQGVRYTTIYLANEGQITNPDLIEPGQIFNVPDEALPNAEELHRRRLRGEPID